MAADPLLKSPTSPKSKPTIVESRTNRINPSRWNTTEFYFYYILILVVVPYMCWTGVDISRPQQQRFHIYGKHLQQGWLFGRLMDNSDAQYGSFRNNFPTLLLVMSLYLILKQLLYWFVSRPSMKNDGIKLKNARINFSLMFSFIFVTALFGASFLKMLFIMGINYGLTKGLGRHFPTPIIIWTMNVGLLFLNEYYDGYRFANLSSDLHFLDGMGGILGNWTVHFNFSALRMISFSMDYYWSLQNKKVNTEDEEDEQRRRIATSCQSADYNFINYLCFLLYCPLFLAGPIITFNDFISQMYLPTKLISTRKTLIYGLRLFACLALMEFMQHFIYVMAMTKSIEAIDDMTPYEVSIMGYFNLKYIWLKLLIIWRFFRWWGLADQIYTEENMTRCMSNAYSPTGFWRMWHRSFNRWIIRYVYIPLGGSRYQKYNTWVVFTFVAIWHDISLKLLAWGWLISLFILPELIAIKLSRPLRSWKYYRQLSGFGAALNMLTMAVANLVGFAVGLSGMKEMLIQLNSLNGYLYVLVVISCFYGAIQLMFEVRESEKRRGVYDRT